MKESVVDGADIPRSILVDEWRAANDYYAELEETEAGLADQAEIADLDPALRPLVDEVMADSRFVRALDELPASFAMVELDLLLVGQPFVSQHHTTKLNGMITPSLTPPPAIL